MVQVSQKPLQKQIYFQVLNSFFIFVTRFKSPQESQSFLEQFLTPTEKIVLAKRLSILLMIAKGYDYVTIRQILKVSPPTIAAISRKYKYNPKIKNYIDSLLADSVIQDFLLKIVETGSSLFGWAAKGGGVWRQINKQAKQARNQLVK